MYVAFFHSDFTHARAPAPHTPPHQQIIKLLCTREHPSSCRSFSPPVVCASSPHHGSGATRGARCLRIVPDRVRGDCYLSRMAAMYIFVPCCAKYPINACSPILPHVDLIGSFALGRAKIDCSSHLFLALFDVSSWYFLHARALDASKRPSSHACNACIGR